MYKKLTEEMFQEIVKKTNEFDNIWKYPGIVAIVKKHFGNAVHLIEVLFVSEYNDEDYDLRARKVNVYDVDGKELKLTDVENEEEVSPKEKFENDLWDLELGKSTDETQDDRITIRLMYERPALYYRG